jgi:CDP-glucose 4,6-dehydratase
MDVMEMIPPNLALFRGARVFVTGDTGFKGSWLSLWLHLLGADVVGYALPPADGQNHFRLLRLDKKIHHVNGDIRDLSALKKEMGRFRPTFLFHLAAQSLVRRSYDDPKTTFDTNIGGSMNVLEAARATPSLRSLVYVTSDKCYKNKEWVWGYRENDELGGGDPYSVSKAAAELIFSSYRDAFFKSRPRFGMASVRAGNVIGGGDWSRDRIVPDCVRALQKNRPIVLRYPQATRPWQHVLDPLYGYLSLATHLFTAPSYFSGSWNFGPREESSRCVKDLADTIVRFWGKGQIRVAPVNPQLHEASFLYLNCEKAHKKLGWFPQWDFERSVRETVVWYRQVFDKKNVFELSKNQIRNYMDNKSDS